MNIKFKNGTTIELGKGNDKLRGTTPFNWEYQDAYECKNCLTLQEHKSKCLKAKKVL